MYKFILKLPLAFRLHELSSIMPCKKYNAGVNTNNGQHLDMLLNYSYLVASGNRVIITHRTTVHNALFLF